MLEKRNVQNMKKTQIGIDNSQGFGTLLPDPWEVFDCLSDEFLIVKLNEYRFSLKVLKLMNNHLFQKNQRTIINEAYGSWEADYL